MIKTLIFSIFSLLITCAVFSQDVERLHRVGFRAAYLNRDNSYWGGELSYQIKLKGMRRLEMGLGLLSETSWSLTEFNVIYQWQLIRKGGFSFYTGPGLGIGYASYGYGDDDFYGKVAGNIGIDYTFRLPLQIAVDWRPGYILWDNIDNKFSNQVGLALRLAF